MEVGAACRRWPEKDHCHEEVNNLQSILLAAAAQREHGSFYPVPESVAGAGARLTKAVAALVEAGLAEERDQRKHRGMPHRW